MSLKNFDAENADNLEDIEKQFAVKVVQQVEVYWNLLQKIPGSKLKLTKYDQEIYDDFLADFPEYKDEEKLNNLDEDEIKNHKNKARWRAFFKKWEKKIDDYNFGTVVRKSSTTEYTEDGTMLVVRMQFYCFEIARNKMGLNDWVSQK